MSFYAIVILMIRRLGIIGDVHEEAFYLEAAIKHLQVENVDTIYCTGDLVDGAYDHDKDSLDKCARLLQENNIVTVAGNHDRWLLNDISKIHELMALKKETRVFLANNFKTHQFTAYENDIAARQGMLCHAHGSDDMLFLNDALNDAETDKERRELSGKFQRMIPNDVNIVVAGHTHRSGVQFLGRLTIINAGTLKRDNDPCFGIVDFPEKRVKFFKLENADLGNIKIEFWRTVSLNRW